MYLYVDELNSYAVLGYLNVGVFLNARNSLK